MTFLPFQGGGCAGEPAIHEVKMSIYWRCTVYLVKKLNFALVWLSGSQNISRDFSEWRKAVKCSFRYMSYHFAGVVELADTPDLGSGAARLGGSSPLARNRKHTAKMTTTISYNVVR